MPVLLIAAHGTRSAAGLATTTRLVAAVQSARPEVRVELAFLDVLSPSLAEALDARPGQERVVVPLLLSAGYHVETDIPQVVAGRRSVRVARHLGPDPLVLEAVADRLVESVLGTRGALQPADRAVDRGTGAGTTLLAAIASSRESARAEVGIATALLAERLGSPVGLLPLEGDVRAVLERHGGPVAVATYLLAEGGFLTKLQTAADGIAAVSDPIGVHPALVRLVLARYDEVCAG